MRPAASSSSSSSSSSAAVELLQIPKALWLMKAPALSLTLASAVNLASANAFGGGSDPFVVVYVVPPPLKTAAAAGAAGAGASGAGAGGKAGAGSVAAPGAKGAGGGAADGVGMSGGGGGGDGGAAEPVFKTRVVEGSLNPVWNETFLVPLHVTMVSSFFLFSLFLPRMCDRRNVLRVVSWGGRWRLHYRVQAGGLQLFNASPFPSIIPPFVTPPLQDAASTTAADFPTLRLEVYDYNRCAPGCACNVVWPCTPFFFFYPSIYLSMCLTLAS